MPVGFWKKLERPILALAPMANVTDAAFRYIIAKYSKYGGQDIGDGSKESLPARSSARSEGGPDVMFTEFVSCDGLCSSGKDALLTDFIYDEIERPIVAQIFGSRPENFYRTALLIQELGFDGIDINMGCPDRNVEKQGAGAKLILNPELAERIIKETKRGAGKLPVSVKTRLGYNKNILEEWLPKLLQTELAAVTLHARTRKEMSSVPARWEEIAKAVQLRDKYDNSSNKTLILGNGDVKTRPDAEAKARETGADGIMVGRGVFGNPWFFNKKITINDIPVHERLRVMLEHTILFEKILGDKKNFANMKKHYKAYVEGFPGAKELRIKLMETKNSNEVEAIVAEAVRGVDKVTI